MIPLRKLGLILSASVCWLIWLSIRPLRFTQYLKAEDPEESDYKYILAWTPDFPNVKLLGWSFPEVDGFQQAGCPEFRCFMTNNRSYLGEIAQIFIQY